MPVGDKQRPNPALKHSVLQNENADPTGRYTIDGRVLQVARAVNKREATKLEEEGVSRRLVRDKDKRRLYLLNEGTIPSNSPLYKKLSPSEIKMREESYKQREAFIKKNPALHLSLTRLSIRNIPRHITSKDLKQLARQAVVGFATDVKAEKRQPLSKEEQQRSRETMKELDYLRKTNKQGIVRQAKIVYETREGTKVPEKGGGGRSRGYGFIEYYTHRHALMGLRWLNCHAVEIPANPDNEERDKKKRLIVEFAIENAQVIKRRNELQAREKEKAKEGPKPEEDVKVDNDKKGTKRKHSQTRDGKGKGKDAEDKGEEDEEENKIAKRNRIIAKKRMQRKGRKGRS
jgi:nucleolar protein 4